MGDSKVSKDNEFSMPAELNDSSPVMLEVLREWRCSGPGHHRIGVECLVRWNGRKYRMLHEDGTPECAFKMSVSTAFCACGARWDYQNGGRAVNRKSQMFE